MPVKNSGARACILDVVAASVVNLWRLCPLDLTAAAYFLLTVTRTPVEASFAEAALLGPEVCMAAVRLGRHGIIGKASTSIGFTQWSGPKCQLRERWGHNNPV